MLRSAARRRFCGRWPERRTPAWLWAHRIIIDADGVRGIRTELEAYYAPDALDAAFYDAVQFAKFRKATRNIDNFLAQFGLRRKVAETRREEGVLGVVGGEGAPFRTHLRRFYASKEPR